VPTRDHELTPAVLTTARLSGSVLVIAAPAIVAVLPNTVVAGLPLVRRLTLVARRAGYARVLVHDPRVDLASLPFGAARLAPGVADLPPDTGPRAAPWRIVLMPANVVPQARWLTSLLQAPLDPGQFFVDGSGAMVVESDDPEGVLAMLAGCATAEDMRVQLSALLDPVVPTLDPTGRFPLAGADDVPRADRWLFRSLIKQSEGFMSRHVERPISLAITRRLLGTRITPNIMTIVSLSLGLASAVFFLSSDAPWQLAGALLLLTHSILDGCDGELARLTFQESKTGAMLDFWGDNIVHVAVFGCMAVGWSLDRHSTWPLVAGGVACASTLGVASLLSGKTMRDETGAADPTLAGRLVEALGHRDFIYLVIVLAAFAKAAWFLAATAVGTPIFLALVVLVQSRRAAIQV
jgi:phosphatidylglycerophosphate synthase